MTIRFTSTLFISMEKLQEMIRGHSRCSWQYWCENLGLLAPAPRILSCISALILMTLASVSRPTAGLPFPPLDLPNNCNSEERCCMPRPYTGAPVRQFERDEALPMRIRRPVHLLDEEEVAQLRRGYQLLRELPDSDPRSFRNQANLHCLYCNNGLYYPNMSWPFEIHNGWLFLPWHRMFLYFHERILAKVVGNDSFALPYWNWDNQTPEPPYANTMPEIYAKRSSPLWNQNRNKCSAPPSVADLNSYGGCTNKSAAQLRVENTRLLYTQLVSGAPTSNLFFGMPYRYGNASGIGPGTLEDNPHGPLHLWLGDPDAVPIAYADMGILGTAAKDPIFYPHHANMDRIWTIWKKLSGKQRTEPVDPDFLHSQFTFYDEDANLVTVNVSQCIGDTKLLRYTYEASPTAWTTNGQKAGEENSVPYCNPTYANSGVGSIAVFSDPNVVNYEPLAEGDVLGAQPLSFRVTRPRRRKKGIEVLEIKGIKIDATLQAHWEAYLFYPSADLNVSVSCPEFFGTFNYVPHVGQAQFNPERLWRAALGPKLVALGKDNYTDIVVTLAQFGPNIQPIGFSKAVIVYDTSPD